MGIDGEFFNIVKPVCLQIKLNKKLGGGSINFLHNVKQKRDKKIKEEKK